MGYCNTQYWVGCSQILHYPSGQGDLSLPHTSRVLLCRQGCALRAPLSPPSRRRSRAAPRVPLRRARAAAEPARPLLARCPPPVRDSLALLSPTSAVRRKEEVSPEIQRAPPKKKNAKTSKDVQCSYYFSYLCKTQKNMRTGRALTFPQLIFCAYVSGGRRHHQLPAGRKQAGPQLVRDRPSEPHSLPRLSLSRRRQGDCIAGRKIRVNCRYYTLA